MQQLIVAFLVAGCGTYVTWRLMPAFARNWVRKRVLQTPETTADGCGGCGGCSGSPQAPCGPKPEQVVQFLRR